MEGTKADSTFPRNKLGISIGENRRLSKVFRSYSTAKLLAVITLDSIRVIKRKKGTNM